MKTNTRKKSPDQVQADGQIQMDRRSVKERRAGIDRRTAEQPVSVDRRASGERRKVARRRQIDPTTCERDYTPEEIEFMHAMDAYKHSSGRMFPTCSEILEVIRDLGYSKCLGAASQPPAASDSATADIS